MDQGDGQEQGLIIERKVKNINISRKLTDQIDSLEVQRKGILFGL